MSNDKLVLDALSPTLVKVGAAVGTAFLVLSVVLGVGAQDGGAHFFHAYLLNLTYFLSISLGALFFVTLHHLTRAGWSTAFRRIAELLAACIPVLLVLFVPIIVAMLTGNTKLYSWVDTVFVHSDHLLHAKAGYLNVPFLVARFAIYGVVWTFFSRYFLNRSVEQDKSGDLRISMRLQQISAPGMFLFALSTTFFAFDFVMSLDPHWYSTMFGVYFFAGCVIAFVASMILIAMGLQNVGILRDEVTVEHFHDLGKLLFGFIFFWGYIAFSQYMLIWYGNIPEETQWYLRRQTGEWVSVSIALLFGHFLIPFPGLMSRHIKRRRPTLAFWAAFMLVMHWLDLYWLVMPSLDGEHLPLGVLEVSCLLGVGGIYVATFAYLTRGKLLMPVRDPRIDESLAFENQ